MRFIFLYRVPPEFCMNFLGFVGRTSSCYPKVISLLLQCVIRYIYVYLYILYYLFMFICFPNYYVYWNSGFVGRLVRILRIEIRLIYYCNSQLDHTIVLCRPHELLIDHRSSFIYVGYCIIEPRGMTYLFRVLNIAKQP